jgi:hypothetical protein
MFRSSPDIERTESNSLVARATTLPETVPVSHLALDLGEPGEPAEGWADFLAARNVEVTLDDIGRMAVSRDAARQLLTEKRDREAEQARRRKLLEARQVADDQIRRASIWGGLSADLIPPGVTPAAAMVAADKAARPKRQSVLQHALSNTGEMVFHPICDEGDAS